MKTIPNRIRLFCFVFLLPIPVIQCDDGVILRREVASPESRRIRKFPPHRSAKNPTSEYPTIAPTPMSARNSIDLTERLGLRQRRFRGGERGAALRVTNL